MLRNIEARAQQSARFLADTCCRTASREYQTRRFVELVDELRQVRAYYLAFSDWLHDAYRRKADAGAKDTPLADWLRATPS